jgi:hypothetical protein
MLEQLGVGGRALEDRALGGEIAEQRDDAAAWLDRLRARRDDRAVDPVLAVGGEPLPQSLAGHGHAIEMQERLELAQQGAHSAAGKEILHVAVADRLEIDQERGGIGQLVEALQR